MTDGTADAIKEYVQELREKTLGPPSAPPAPPAGPGEDLELDEARRSFDRALAVRQAGDERAQALLQLSLALLGGGVGSVLFLFGLKLLKPEPGAFLVAWTALAVICNLAAAFMFVQAYSGFSKRVVAIGPSLRQIREEAGKRALQGQTLAGDSLRLFILGVYAEEYASQNGQSNGEAQLRRQALRVLAVAVGLYSIGMVIALVWSGLVLT